MVNTYERCKFIKKRGSNLSLQNHHVKELKMILGFQRNISLYVFTYNF
jgi:hypothetical protein